MNRNAAIYKSQIEMAGLADQNSKHLRHSSESSRDDIVDRKRGMDSSSRGSYREGRRGDRKRRR